jgi:hypothetical protein
MLSSIAKENDELISKKKEEDGSEQHQRSSHSDFKLRILTKKKVSVPSGVVIRDLPPRHNNSTWSSSSAMKQDDPTTRNII